jgi:hypothetical protein
MERCDYHPDARAPRCGGPAVYWNLEAEAYCRRHAAQARKEDVDELADQLKRLGPYVRRMVFKRIGR